MHFDYLIEVPGILKIDGWRQQMMNFSVAGTGTLSFEIRFLSNCQLANYLEMDLSLFLFCFSFAIFLVRDALRYQPRTEQS